MRKYPLLLALLAGPGWAQAPGDDTVITVVASGDRAAADATGQPISILPREEIERIQGADVVRVLERLPGVTLTRNGGPGAFTALRVRGAEADQLLVLVDGVRVADTAAPAGGFDFGTLLPTGIARVELLRGSNSTIWGSQAMGGVLAIETRDGGVAGSVEYGGPEAIYAQASAGRTDAAMSWGVDGAFVDSEGISAAAEGTEPDGLRQWQVGAHGEAQLASGLSATAVLRHLDARADLDGFPAPDFTLADTPEYQDTLRTDGSAGVAYRGAKLELRATWSLSDTRRKSFDPSSGPDPTYTTDGRDERGELRGRWRLADVWTLHFGAERAWSRMATLSDVERRVGSRAGYAQLGYWNGAVALNAGLRVEDHDRFGSAWTFGADGAVRLGNGWRLRASYGEGFKAPTLFQLLSDYGNAALRPERSRGFDLGIENGDRAAPIHLAASLFRRDSSDLIDFVSCFGISDGICADRPFGTYDNVARARAQGGELEVSAKVGERLRVQGAYSYVEAKNRAPAGSAGDRDLARRPRHAATVSADWSSPWTLQLGADLRIVSGSFDDAANAVRMAGYAVVTLRAEWPLTDQVALFGRAENALDENYQTAAGYGTPGRSAYLGARARF